MSLVQQVVFYNFNETRILYALQYIGPQLDNTFCHRLALFECINSILACCMNMYCNAGISLYKLFCEIEEIILISHKTYMNL